MMFRILALGACALAAACTTGGARVEPAVSVALDEAPRWRALIQPQDSQRLDALPASWSSLYGKLPARVRTANAGLADPGAALEYPTPSPGAYLCRKLRLRADRRASAVRSPATDACYVAGSADGFAFTKQTGADLSSGYLYPDGNRYVYLGARQRRVGDTSLGYGSKPAEDVVGVVERIGGFRWRLIVAGGNANQVDIYEITPVAADQQPRQSPSRPG